jgi:hypothetical protein
VKVRVKHLGNGLEIQANSVQLPLQARKRLGGIDPGIDQEKTVIRFDKIHMHVIQPKWQGNG